MASYNHSRIDAQGFGLKLPELTTEPAATLSRQLIAACDEAVGFASSAKSPLSPQEADRLNHIRKETDEVCRNLDIHFRKNLELATKHYERGDFLGSALITSRIIAYVLAQFEGKTIEAKISFLEKNDLLEKNREDVKQSMIKADKNARDILAHRIDTYADPSDASSLLGDCLKVLRIYVKFLESKEAAT